jgi:thiaminase/transcriptional activator TenA
VTESFSQLLREESRGVWEAIFAHPFLAELAAGTLPLEKFQYFLTQDWLYLEGFGRAVALALGRAPDSDGVTRLAARVLTPIERPLHARLFELAGVSLAEAAATDPTPATRAYMDHMLVTAGFRGLGETAAALLPCPWSYDEIGKRLAQLEESPNSIYREWVGFYTSGFLRESVRAWRELLELSAAESNSAERLAMQEAFLLSSRHELAFWDAAYRLERWPDDGSDESRPYAGEVVNGVERAPG